MSDTTFLPIGTLLSRQYRILQHIGAGGFGKTYLVEDQLGEKRVVKEFFISSMCTRDVTTHSVTVSVEENKQSFQEQLAKFKEEALRIYSLSHPNIVKVSALFNENDTAYYVMNYVEGESLAQKSKKEKLSEAQIRHYLDQILSALYYIHSQGITHLDIKPGNIMIDRDDNVVLIDFGASKLFNAQSVNKTMMTSMRPPFTPGYAPLEQENGDVKDMGPHCDIYALGATLYYLFTGEKAPSPFVILQNGLPAIPNASQQMQNVIKGAMAAMVRNRIKNVAEFSAILNSGEQQTIQTIQPIAELDETKNAPSEHTETVVLKRYSAGTTAQKTDNTNDNSMPSGALTKIIVAMAIVVMLLVGGIVAWMITSGEEEEEKTTAKEEVTVTTPEEDKATEAFNKDLQIFKMNSQNINKNDLQSEEFKALIDYIATGSTNQILDQMEKCYGNIFDNNDINPNLKEIYNNLTRLIIAGDDTKVAKFSSLCQRLSHHNDPEVGTDINLSKLNKGLKEIINPPAPVIREPQKTIVSKPRPNPVTRPTPKPKEVGNKSSKKLDQASSSSRSNTRTSQSSGQKNGPKSSRLLNTPNYSGRDPFER